MAITYEAVEGGFSGGNSLPTTLKTVPDRLAYALKQLGQDESVRVTGKSWKSLQRYAAGADAPMSVVAAVALAASVPLDWLVHGWMPGRTTRVVALAAEGAEPQEFALLPRYSVQVSAGTGLIAQEEIEVERIAFRLDWLREIGLSPDDAGLLTAAGDSMFPTIPDGALMLVDRRKDQPIRSGFIYVIVLAGEVLVKRVSRNVDNTIDLISDNPLYPVKNIPQTAFDDLFIAGRVFWVGRKL